MNRVQVTAGRREAVAESTKAMSRQQLHVWLFRSVIKVCKAPSAVCFISLTLQQLTLDLQQLLLFAFQILLVSPNVLQQCGYLSC
jgi:hypothetical protein